MADRMFLIHMKDRKERKRNSEIRKENKHERQKIKQEEQ
jgi:hypothetical protein